MSSKTPPEKPANSAPRFELETYRKFIRDAAPFVSLVIGRKIHASEGDLLSDEALNEIAEKIDKRVDDLNADIARNKPAFANKTPKKETDQ